MPTDLAPSPKQPIHRMDGRNIFDMFTAGYGWLRQHSQIVNALNVFPVPDGDTGTNMVLTMQAACREAEKRLTDKAGEVVQAFADGAIRGARGNSGVILSQILRGMAEHLRGASVIDASEFAGAMRRAQQTAYKGVLKPVEGTILTVVREAAEACGHAAAIDPDLRFVLETTLAKAQQALANTPNLLPILKQAGVVDAGGQGLVYILEGSLKYLRGESIASAVQAPGAAGAAGAAMAAGAAGAAGGDQPLDLPRPDLGALTQDEWGYDIQYLIFNSTADESAIRQRLLEMGGESVVVGGSKAVIKVHVHSPDPGPFLSYGATLGQLDDIVLENMTLQTLRRKGEWSESAAAQQEPASTFVAPPPSFEPPRMPAECYGIVAVVSGDGLRKVFESLGVCALVAGGQSMNPSAEELLHAIDSLSQPEVIVLPNNKNIILAARQAAELATKPVHVLETKSIPQGIAAMLGFHPSASVERNVSTMTASSQLIHTAEVTAAVRDASFDSIDVHEGDVIGLIDGKLTCKGASADEVVTQILQRLDPEHEMELFTLYYGEPVTAAEAASLAAQIEEQFPTHVVEMLPGGQPHYHYLLSVE